MKFRFMRRLLSICLFLVIISTTALAIADSTGVQPLSVKSTPLTKDSSDVKPLSAQPASTPYPPDSVNMGPLTLNPTSAFGGYYVTGQTELFCNNNGAPLSSPRQYHLWSNCSTPQIEDYGGNPIVCPNHTYPLAYVTLSQTDFCSTMNTGKNLTPPTSGYTLFALRLYPPNGQVGWSNSSKNAYAICFNQAYSVPIGINYPAFPPCNNCTYTSAIIVNYIVSCVPCTNGACLNPTSVCPSYNGPTQTVNNGVGSPAPWCGLYQSFHST